MFGRSEHTLWVEKYRPDDLDNYIGNDVFKSSIMTYLEKNDIPNLILYGPAGTGKTTAATMIAKNMNCDFIYLNGSDNNGIDTVRTTIKDFASAASFFPLKVIIFDDCATLTDQAQNGLLNMVETFSKNTRFIFTTNHLDRLIDPLKSRCISFKIEPPSKKDVAKHIHSLIVKEDVEATMVDIATIVKKYYPDIRKCVNITQECIVDNKLFLKFDNLTGGSYLDDILRLLKAKDWRGIRNSLNQNGVTDYAELFRYLYDQVEEYSPNNYAECIIAISQAQYQNYFVPDKEINTMEMILKIIKTM